jgi:formate dehydrogenase gamma subunit
MRGLPLARFLIVALVVMCFATMPAAAAEKPKCLDCHSDKINQAEFSASAHGLLGCTGCHEVTKYPHEPKPAKPSCVTCHPDQVKEDAASAHGQSRANGHLEAASCQDCHGSVHTLKPASDPASKVAKVNLPRTCGNCHSNADLVAKFHIPIARPLEAYEQSVHGRAVQRGVANAPACSDCHGSHNLFAAADLRSRVNRARVPATCGACHTQIAQQYRQSVHGRAAARGISAAPICTDCHGEHAIRSHTDQEATTSATRLSADLCARCHDDPRLAENFNMPTDRAATYFESFHGLASRSGSANVANCASCHGVHDIRAASDPESAVNPRNLNQTCGQCHPNAGQRFALGKIHVPPQQTATRAAGLVARAYLWLIIPFTIGGMLIHNLLDLRWKARRRRFGFDDRPLDDRRVMYLNERIQHGLLAISFMVLVITGFALKFPESWWARPIVMMEGRMPLRAWTHRIAAVILISAAIQHVLYIVFSERGRAHWKQLLPVRRDLTEFFAALRQYLGGPKARLSTYNYIHKAEYWALVWGTVVMAASGSVLWFNSFSLRFFPRWVMDLSTTIHYYEAILAALAVLVWHGYWVIFDPNEYPMDWMWLTGKPAHPASHSSGRGNAGGLND